VQLENNSKYVLYGAVVEGHQQLLWQMVAAGAVFAVPFMPKMVLPLQIRWF